MKTLSTLNYTGKRKRLVVNGPLHLIFFGLQRLFFKKMDVAPNVRFITTNGDYAIPMLPKLAVPVVSKYVLIDVYKIGRRFEERQPNFYIGMNES